MDSRVILKLMILKVENKFVGNNKGNMTVESVLIFPILIIVIYLILQFVLVFYNSAVYQSIIYYSLESQSNIWCKDKLNRDLYWRSSIDYKDTRLQKVDTMLSNHIENFFGDTPTVISKVKAGEIEYNMDLKKYQFIDLESIEFNALVSKKIYDPAENLRNFHLIIDNLYRYTSLNEYANELDKYIDLFNEIGENYGQ